ANNTVVDTIFFVGLGPYGVAVNPMTNRVYVTNFVLGLVTVIDGATDGVVDFVLVGLGPTGITANPLTNRIYVVNSLGTTVSVLDGGNDRFVTDIEIGVL